MNYPHGSVPYGPDTPALRIKRFMCAAVNHHPRFFDGSWCWGYGYVCSRCAMYADPWSATVTAAKAKALGYTPGQQEVAKIARATTSQLGTRCP